MMAGVIPTSFASGTGGSVLDIGLFFILLVLFQPQLHFDPHHFNVLLDLSAHCIVLIFCSVIQPRAKECRLALLSSCKLHRRLRKVLRGTQRWLFWNTLRCSALKMKHSMSFIPSHLFNGGDTVDQPTLQKGSGRAAELKGFFDRLTIRKYVYIHAPNLLLKD